MSVVPLVPATLDQQADMIWRLVSRCMMADGRPADETILTLARADYDDLKGIEARLRRMAPHEAAIKRVVIGK